MNTAREHKSNTKKLNTNGAQSNLFIAPKQSSKKQNKTTQKKDSTLFIVPKKNSEPAKSKKSTTPEEKNSPKIALPNSTFETVGKNKSSGNTDKATPKKKGTAQKVKQGKGTGKKNYESSKTPTKPETKKELQKTEEKELNLPTENSKVYVESLATQIPTNFIKGVKQANKAVEKVQNNEKSTLEKSLPEIEQPTGIPTKSAANKKNAKEASKTLSDKIKGDKSILPDLKPTGKKEGDKISEKSIQPPSSVWEMMKRLIGFGTRGSDDDRKAEIKSGINKLPTSESVSTDPGENPEVDLTGQADPKKNQENIEDSNATTDKEQAKNLAESKIYHGENDIYPEMELEMLSPTTKLSQVQPTTALTDEMPIVSDEVKSSFDKSAQEQMDKELAPEMMKQDTEYQKMLEDQDLERAATDNEIEKETKRVKKEQVTAQNSAKTDVDSQRTEWKKENEAVKKDYTDKTETEKKKIDENIEAKVNEADTKITKEYDSAKKEADKEVDKTDKEAEAKKKEAKRKSEKRSWWDRAVDAVSDFFDKLKEGLNKLFDGLRSLVKGIIEAAKKLANKLIDLARDAIVGMIKAFGEVLKGFVNIALAAFPKLRDKFNAAIDKAVNVAVKAVNDLAEGLKKAVNALLDLLGDILDAILSAYQAFFNALIDVMKFLTVGLIKILRFLWNLVKGAYYAPGEFLGALAIETLGGNPAEPLQDIEVPIGQEEKWALSMGLNKVATTQTVSEKSKEMPTGVQKVLTKQTLLDSDITIEPNPAVTLDPELIAGLPPLEEGKPYDLGGAGVDAITTQQFQASAADAAGYTLNGTIDGSSEQSYRLENEELTKGNKPDPDWRNMSDDQKLTHYNNQMLVESETVGNQEPQPGKVKSQPTKDNSPEALITKTGRLEVGKRLAFMGQQMMTGLQVFWNKNKVWIIAALVAALLVAGVIAFFTGGAGLVVAVDIIVKAMILIFGAYAVYQAMGHIWDYVKKAWAGDAEGAGKSLARAMAVIVMEFLIDKILLGMGKVFKRILKTAKATKVGKAITKGVKVLRKGSQKVGKFIRKGISKIKGNKLVVYMKNVVGKGTKKLSELRKNILKKFGFKRLWLEKHGKWIELWGEFNAKILLVRERTQKNGQKEYSTELVGDGNIKGKTRRARTDADESILGGKPPKTKKQVIVSDDFVKYLKELKETNPLEHQKVLKELDDALKTKSKKEIRDLVKARASESTKQLRKGIGKPQPKNFQAHHIIPRETKKMFDKFFNKIGFDIENGAINGVMVPPNQAIIDAAKIADPSLGTKFDNFAYHLGSHPDYTRLIEGKLKSIELDLITGVIDNTKALKRVIEVAKQAKNKIKTGGKAGLNTLIF